MTQNNLVQDIVEKSGHNLHSQVVNFLRANDWIVLISPYYTDNFTEKPREVDIIAEKAFDVKFFDSWCGTLNIQLFIECKYINREVVFWFDTVDKEKLIRKTVVETGLEPPWNNLTINGHRYMSINSVAKLFASESDKLPENESFYKALSQSLNALVYYKNSSSIIPNDPQKRQKILLTLHYPVIVCNDFTKLYMVNVDAPDSSQQITNNFHLEINYAYPDKNRVSTSEYFLIDVVNFEKMSDFLNTLNEKDVRTLHEPLAFKSQKKGNI
jgi:hypothetical protein